MKKLPDSTTIGEARRAGRLGDQHLVHLNSAEVAMLEDMTYGHGLTVNPKTGEREAFLPFLLSALPALFPALGTAAAGATGLSMLANPLVLGAIGSGLGTAIETGDLGKGLQAGLMGAALGGIGGKLLGGMGGAAASEGAKAAATSGLSQSAAQGLAQAGNAVANAGAGTVAGTAGRALAQNVAQAAKTAALPASSYGMLQAGLVGAPGAMITASHMPESSPTEADKKRKARIAYAEEEKFPMARTVNTMPMGYRPGIDPEFDFFSEARGYSMGGLVESLSPMAALMSGDMGPLAMLSPLAMLDYNRPGTPESRRAAKKGYAMGGPVEGPGDGTSDSIPAVINGQEPAALSDGEYVVPSMAVAALGNGSTKAGQARLDAMVRDLLDSITAQ